MHVTQLYRRGIVLPRTPEALDAIRSNDVSEQTQVSLFMFQSHGDFYGGWRVFEEINAQCGTIIDDYEETEVAPEDIKKMMVILARLGRGASPEDARFYTAFTELCGQALQLGMPLFFMF